MQIIKEKYEIEETLNKRQSDFLLTFSPLLNFENIIKILLLFISFSIFPFNIIPPQTLNKHIITFLLDN